jgi:mRNA interferase MazF
MNQEIHRGDVWWVRFVPSVGGEVRKTRPAVVVSNDTANRVSNRIQVVPTTSNLSRLYKFEAYVTVRGARSKATADNLTTVSKLKVLDRIGHLDLQELEAVDAAIKEQLGLR